MENVPRKILRWSQDDTRTCTCYRGLDIFPFLQDYTDRLGIRRFRLRTAILYTKTQSIYRISNESRSTFVSKITLRTDEARSTLTYESVQHVDTRTTILTRFRGAIVDQMLASFTRIKYVACAFEVVYQIRTFATVHARLFFALVDVYFAIGTLMKGEDEAPFETHSRLWLPFRYFARDATNRSSQDRKCIADWIAYRCTFHFRTDYPHISRFSFRIVYPWNRPDMCIWNR